MGVDSTYAESGGVRYDTPSAFGALAVHTIQELALEYEESKDVMQNFNKNNTQTTIISLYSPIPKAA